MLLTTIRNLPRQSPSRAHFISRALRALAPSTSALVLAGIALGVSPSEARADTPSEPPAVGSPAAPSVSPEPAEPAPVEPTAETPPPKPKPAPYSLPWQLRPAGAANVVRSDTAFALMKSPANGNGGATIATMLLGSYAVIPDARPGGAGSASSATALPSAKAPSPSSTPR